MGLREGSRDKIETAKKEKKKRGRERTARKNGEEAPGAKRESERERGE